MKIRSVLRMADSPVTEPGLAAVEHAAQGQIGADRVRPPGSQWNSCVQAQLMVPESQANQRGFRQLLGVLALPVIIEAVESPVAAGREIDLPVGRASRQSHEGFETWNSEL